MSRAGLTAAALVFGAAGPTFAQPDLFSEEAVSARVELRAAAADGERAWLRGGFGKGRFGGEGGDWRLDGEIADATLEWRPVFGGSFSGLIDVQLQSDQDDPFGVNEAYLQSKPLFPGPVRIAARAGLFYPPVSLEHDGPSWTTTRTITPSALNSWIGEEVKVGGLEVAVRGAAAGHELGLTLAGFGFNDTSGTLLSFRGWSLGDVRATASGDFALPPLSPFMTPRQRPRTTPVLELDDRTGYYVRAEWRPPARVAFDALHYDNRGDRISVEDVEWAWETRFTNLGMVWRPSDDVEVLAQAMWGETWMGFPFPAGVWVDVEFEAAYLLVSRRLGASALTGRIDVFSTDDKASPLYGDNSEDGWAATLAWRRTLNPTTEVLLEALRIDSERPGRALAGVAPHQVQHLVQASARFSF